MRQTQAIDLKQGRGAGFVGLDHAAPATGVTTHRRQTQRKVSGDQAGVNQRADQRDSAGGVATGVGDAARALHGGLLAGGQFGKAVDPAGRGAVRGRGVNDLGAGLAAGRCHGINDGHCFAGSVIMQTQDDHIDPGHQRAFGGGVFAQFGGDADQLDAGHALQPFTDLQARGAGFAVDKNFGHGVCSCLCGLGGSRIGAGGPEQDVSYAQLWCIAACYSYRLSNPAPAEVTLWRICSECAFPEQAVRRAPSPLLSGSYFMKIHEYQGKEILRNFGVPVPRGIPAFTVQEAVEAAQKLGGPVWVVKAQIHAGGRGKGGGVKLARSIEEVKKLAGEILGMQLITHQTGPEGQKVRRLLIEEGADIKKEYYVSAVTDRATQKVAMIVSSEGGMDIEEVAHSTPEKIITDFVDPAAGLTTAQAQKLVAGIGVPQASQAQAIDVLQKLYKVYMETDASLVEINPMILEGNGNIKAIDAKFNFDPNALFRHPEINGAGLAMATMDTIKLFGGEPANFLDVGGGATAEKVTEAFKIMLKNPEVKGILVNIFGGIMKCDTIAEGVITACKAVNLSVPLVVRMKGTNEDLGKKMLADSGLPIIAADTMAEAATKIVAAVK